MTRKIYSLFLLFLISTALFPQQPEYLCGQWELMHVIPLVETTNTDATQMMEQVLIHSWHREYDRFEEYTTDGEIIKREYAYATYEVSGNKILRKEENYVYTDTYSLVNDSLFLYRDFKDEYSGSLKSAGVKLEKAVAEVLYVKLHTPEEVDELPRFPGGESLYEVFISQHLVTPERGEDCTVTIPVIVNKYGELSHNQSGRTHAGLSMGGVSLGTYHQAIREMLLKMPRWKPALKNGYPVNVQIYMPFEFKPE